ncbi:MAG: hypothetical protein WAO28_00825 [Candidatus Microsaccharimonas sp.]
MAKGQGKTGLIITIVVLGLTVLVVGAIAFWQNGSRQADQKATDTTETASPEETATDTPAKTEETDTPTPAADVDPATLSSIDIEALSITVFYTKGLPGFEYSIKKTADNTQYIEFTAPKLVGTKCTDDTGSFASIVKNPSSPENQSTISATTKVGDDTYGLSLAGKNCTPDEALLDQYQTAFSNGFSSLKAME